VIVRDEAPHHRLTARLRNLEGIRAVSLKSASSLSLTEGSRIAVVGGGPAGSLFAIHALHYAQQVGRRIRVTIFERKDFSLRGPLGCNKCAGILSSHLLRGLKEVGITLPADVIMGHVRSYVLHIIDPTEVEIEQPDPTREIVSIYRGSGPRLAPTPPPRSFDGFLLDQARRRGAEVIPERVNEVSYESDRPRLKTAQREETFDLVVMAIGVNARPFEHPGLDYVAPRTEVMAQDELLVANEWTHLGHAVHVYFSEPRGLLFGGLIPKGSFVNVSLLGHGLHKDSVGQFLATEAVQRVVPSQAQRLCGCAPRVAVSGARGYYASRFVAVGDAAVTRLYKDGIGSALVTARCAAETAILHGVSRQAFRVHYAPTCRRIAHDNFYGRILFDVMSHWKHYDLLSRPWLRLLVAERDRPPAERLYSRILWGLFTGDDSYRDIFRMLFGRRAQAGLLVAAWQELWNKKPTHGETILVSAAHSQVEAPALEDE